jgi:hypothetical protein
MSNIDNPRGLWPLRHLTGGEIRTNSYILTTSTAVYNGDLVKVVAGGTVEPGAATSGAIIIGVSAEYVAAANATAGTKIQVYDDPNIVFGIQADTGTAVAATDIFASADHVATAGSATTGRSAMELDSSDLATTAQAQLKVLGLVDTPDNAWGEHADLEVVLNEHYFKSSAVGV